MVEVMVSAAVYEPEPAEGHPDWVPELFAQDDKKFYRNIYVLQTDELGPYGWKEEEKRPWFPNKLPEVIAWLQGIYGSIPQEHRGEVWFRLDCDGDEEEGHRVTLRIVYERLATADEVDRWQGRRDSEVNAQIRRDMAELNRLKKKLGV